MTDNSPDSGPDNPILSGVDNDLLIDLGWQLYRDDLSGGPMPIEMLRAAAIKWVGAKYHDLQSAICPHFQRIAPLLRSDVSVAATAVADLISGLCIGVSPFTVSRICIQIGLTNICRTEIVP